MKILFANHHTVSLPPLEASLQAQGLQVLYSRNIVETVATLEREEPDLVVYQPLTDQVGGFEIQHVLGQAREGSDPRVLLVLEDSRTLTPLADDSLHRVHDFLLRPVRPEELALRIEFNIVLLERFRQLEKVTRSLEMECITDFKTGIYNDRFFFQRLREEVNRSIRHGLALSLVMFDFDNFKEINDQFDHTFGDFVLLAFARKLRAEIRQIDIPARLGGDEFALLLPSTDLEEATQMASRLRELVSEYRFEKDGRSTSVSLSMGIDSLPGEEGANAESFLRSADRALLEAKRRGKNRICLASELRERQRAAGAG